MSATLTVHVRVHDAATGKPTPVRIRVAGPDGQYFAPLGRPDDFPIGRNEEVGGHVYLNKKRYAYIDGSCEIPLPSGVPLDVEITKGPLYETVRQTVTLGPGQMALRFPVRRWPDDRWAGLVSADTRCHFLSPHAARLEADAEGIDLVHLLATVQDYRSHDGHLYRSIPNMTAFSGQRESVPGVFVNTFNAHPALGRLGLLNCHRAVYPLTFGGFGEMDDWSLADWCQQCHRKNGLVVWCDAYRVEAGIPGGEGLIDTILGKVDAIEFDAHDRTAPFLPMLYRLWNAGIRVPIVGGSGKDSNRIALGGMRTMTPAGTEPTSDAAWVEHVRAGRAWCSNGPLLRLFVDEQFDVAKVHVSPGQPVRLRAEAASAVPFEWLEMVANGQTVARAAPTGDGVWSAVLEAEHSMNAGGWVAARCWGAMASDLYPHGPVFAHTGPIDVALASVPAYRDPAALPPLRRDVERVRDWVEREGRFAIPRRKEFLLSLCDEALGRLSG